MKRPIDEQIERIMKRANKIHDEAEQLLTWAEPTDENELARTAKNAAEIESVKQIERRLAYASLKYLSDHRDRLVHQIDRVIEAIRQSWRVATRLTIVNAVWAWDTVRDPATDMLLGTAVVAKIYRQMSADSEYLPFGISTGITIATDCPECRKVINETLSLYPVADNRRVGLAVRCPYCSCHATVGNVEQWPTWDSNLLT